MAGQERYMREAIPVLEADANVYRYAWFSASPIPNARLFDDQSSLTPLGGRLRWPAARRCLRSVSVDAPPAVHMVNGRG